MSIEDAQKIGESVKINYLFDIDAANAWAIQILERDQYPRRILQALSKKEISLDESFFNADLQSLSIELQQDQQKFKDALKLMEQEDEKNIQAVRAFLNTHGFPSLTVSPLLVNTCWLIIQHADKYPELQIEALQKMHLARSIHNDAKLPEISLVYFYYLTDRITMKKYQYQYQYQYFGTQSKGNYTQSLPDNLLEEFYVNPSGVCIKLASVKYETHPPDNHTMLNLWELAAKESTLRYGNDPKFQDVHTHEFVKKYNKPT